MTDAGDVSQISEIAPSGIHEDVSQGSGDSRGRRSASPADQEGSTWDSERDADTSVSASQAISDNRDAWLVEQCLPSASLGRFVGNPSNYSEENTSSDEADIGMSSTLSTSSSAVKLHDSQKEINSQSPTSRRTPQDLSKDTETSLDSLRLDISQTESLLPAGCVSSATNAMLLDQSLPCASRKFSHNTQDHGHEKILAGPESFLSISLIDSLGKTSKSRSSNFRAGASMAQISEPLTVMRLLPPGKQSPGSQVALEKPVLHPRSLSASSSSSSSASRGSLLASQSTSLDVSFSFNDSFLRREGAKLNRGFWDGQQAALASQPNFVGKNDACVIQEARSSRDITAEPSKAKGSQHTLRQSQDQPNSAADALSLNKRSVDKNKDQARNVSAPLTSTSASSAESETEDGIRPKETHIRPSAREPGTSSPQTQQADGPKERDEESPAIDAKLPNQTAAVETSPSQSSTESKRSETSDSQSAADSPGAADNYKSELGENAGSVSFTTAMTASPSADKFRRLALAKSSAQRRLQQLSSSKEPEASDKSTIILESQEFTRDNRLPTSPSKTFGSDESSSPSFASARISNGSSHVQSPVVQITTPRSSAIALSENVKLGPWSPATHLPDRQLSATAASLALATPSKMPCSDGRTTQQGKISPTAVFKQKIAALEQDDVLPASCSSVDADTRLSAVRLALDEYLCAHSVRLSVLSQRLDSSSSEASTLRELLSVELEGKGALLREVAGLKWDLEVARREADRAEELRERERSEGERRDEELRRLVEKMRQQVEKRAQAASGGDVFTTSGEMMKLREQLEYEKRMREQERRDFEVRLMLASRAGSTSVSPSVSRLSASAHAACTRAITKDDKDEAVRLARQSMERDHEVRVYAMQKEHDQALDVLESQLEQATRQRDDALGQLQDGFETRQQVAELQEQIVALTDELEEMKQQARERCQGSHVTENTIMLRQQVSKLEGRCQELQEKARTVQAGLTQEMQQQVDGFHAALEEVEAQREELGARSEQERSHARDAIDEAASLREQLEDLTAGMRTLQEAHQQTITRLQEEARDTQNQRADLALQLDAVLEELDNAAHAQKIGEAKLAEQDEKIKAWQLSAPPVSAMGAMEARVHELSTQLKLTELSLEASRAQQQSSRQQVSALQREVGDRGLTVSKLQRANEKLEMEIQNHAIALAGKQQELSLLKRRVRRAGLQELVSGSILRPTVRDTDKTETGKAGRGRPHESIDTQVLERGPLPSRARGRRTMDVDHPAGSDYGAFLAMGTSRLANIQSKEIAASTQCDNEDGENTEGLWKGTMDGPDASQDKENAEATSGSKAPSAFVNSSRASLDLDATPQDAAGLSSLRLVSAAARSGRVGASEEVSARSSTSSPHQYEPMSLNELTVSRAASGTPRAFVTLSTTRQSLSTVALERRHLRRGSNSSALSVRTSTSSRGSSRSSLAELPSFEPFLAKRQAANAAVQRMLSLGGTATATGTAGPRSGSATARRRNESAATADAERRVAVPA